VTAAIALIGIVLGAGPAAAAAPSVAIRVEFDAPPGCSDAQTFSDALADRSQSIRFAKPGEPATLLRVHLTRAGNQVHGELSVVDAAGATDSRRVDGSSCDEVARGLSLTASLALDRMLPPHADAAPPDAHNTPPTDAGDGVNSKSASEPGGADASKTPASRPSEPPPPRQETAPAEPTQEPSGPPTPRAHTPIFTELGLEAAAAELVAPKWDLGGGLSARVHQGTSGPTLGLEVLYLSNDALSASPDLVVSWAGAALSACPLRMPIGAPFWFEPCALGSGGRLSVSDRLALHKHSSTRSWWSAGGLLRGGWDVAAETSVYFEIGLSIPLVERRFVIEDPVQAVGRTPLGSVLFAIGLSYRL
jgi:hypothetical protein